MAVDTRDKRASILGLALASLLVLPAPDTTIAESERQHVAYCYASGEAEAPAEPGGVTATVSDAAVTEIALSDSTVTTIALSDTLISSASSSDALLPTTVTVSDAAVTTLTISDVLLVTT